MSRQDNLASQERVVVNGRHCVDTEKSLCSQGNGCVNTTLFDRFCVLIHGFLVQGCVKSSFLVEKVTF